MRTLLAAGLGALASAVVLFAAGGCEALVGDTLGGDVRCIDVPGACPTGQGCVGGVCKACAGGACVSHDGGLDAPVDAGGDRDATMMRDVTTDTGRHDGNEAAALYPLGHSCSTGTECSSGLCAGTDVFTAKVSLPATGVCTQPCCNSGECNTAAAGFLCYPSVGGNYCIEPAWIGLSGVGPGAGGATCSGGAGCASGVCTKGRCQDTCCRDTDCTGGTSCQFSQLDTQLTLSCELPKGPTGQGQDCYLSTCRSSACLSPLFYCLGGCCSDSDCNPLGDGTPTACVWSDLPVSGDAGQVELRACAVPGDGGAPYMGGCTANTECASGVCNTMLHKCTKACCKSADCTPWACGPESFTLGIGTVDLQVCVPVP